MKKGQKHSKESKSKISKNRKGKCCGDLNPSKRPEVKIKKSEKMKGDLNPAKRPEVRAKISKTLKGNIPWNKGKTYKSNRRSEQSKQNISNALMGHKVSDETKNKISEKHKGLTSWNKGLTSEIDDRIIHGKNHHNYGKSPTPKKRYYYESLLQNEVCFRSSYELAYAKYLDSQKILWMYEEFTFDLGNITYTPDFFLIKDDKFIEVKGWLDSRSEEKINKFLEQYPFDLEILYKDDLIKLGVEL